MIIKSFRVPTSSSLGRLRDHVFRGEENTEVRVLRGCEADLSDFRDLAIERGASHALRHFIVAPKQPMATLEFMAVVDDLGHEFRFDPHLCVVILHRKPRREGSAETHLHILVPEVHPATGGILSSSHDYVRHEKIARIVEHRHAHPFVEGAHLSAVLAALEKESRHDVCDALATAFPDRTRPAQAFSTVNAKRVKRQANLDLAGLKIDLRRRWGRDASVAALASWLSENGIDLAEGEKPGTVILSKDGVHIAALHRLLGLRKEVVFKEFRNVSATNAARQPVAEQSSTEPRSTNPPRNEDDPLPDRGCNHAGEPGRRRRRRRSAPFDLGYPEFHSGNAQGAEAERRSTAPAPERPDPAYARRKMTEARIRIRISSENRDRLEEHKCFAHQLALNASTVAQIWIDEVLRKLEAEEETIRSPLPTTSEALDRAVRDETIMRAAIGKHQREIAALEIAIAEAEKPKRTGFLWTLKKERPPEFDRLREALTASKDRLSECERIREKTASARREEQQRIANRAGSAAMSLPSKIAELDDRKQAIEVLRKEFLDNPTSVFGGPDFYCRRIDVIFTQIREHRIEDYSKDYKNRTDMWGIGQLKRPC